MQTQLLHQIIYSPTHTSKAVVTAVAGGCNPHQSDIIDLTLPQKNSSQKVLKGDLAVIGVPVYAGRVAPEAAKRIASIKANKIPAILVVVYGNREFEDALIELRDLAIKAGFIPIACGAFIGEHSYSSPDKPIAANRPDSADIAKAQELGITAMKKFPKSISSIANINVPGDTPYKDYLGPSGVSPDVDMETCGLCGDCVNACPVGAIAIEDKQLNIDKQQCTMCCACVKICSKEAMKVNVPRVLERIDLLYQNCQARKEPELFFLNNRPFEAIQFKTE